MSSASTKIIQAAAGNAAGEGLYVEEVFSTYLYEGNDTARSITNGVNLDEEGGLVWTKARNASANHALYDTERGTNKAVFTNLTNAESDFGSNTLTAFNTDGFSLGTAGISNDSDENYVSWTFRKAPKFFDMVTWTGDGTGARTISHNLGATVGALFMKATNAEMQWFSFHNGLTNQQFLELNATTQAVSSVNAWNNTTPTSTQFSVGSYGNISGRNYVAYLFAHNDGDGEFGENADQDIIKCGSYTEASSGNTTEVDLGFEPSFILAKSADSAADWQITDVMRGMQIGTSGKRLAPNSSNAEADWFSGGGYQPTATGFIAGNNYNGAGGDTVIYIAIRRGPMKTPESGTEVFAVDGERGGSGVEQYYYGYAGFPVDLALIHRKSGSDHTAYNRLTFTSLATNSTAAESSSPASRESLQNQEGYYYLSSGWTTDSDRVTHMFRRAPGFFDVVAYTGTGTEPRTVYHNLGVAPEMIWTKRRDSGSLGWVVWHKVLTTNTWLRLDSTQAETSSPAAWGGTFSADNYTIANDPYDAINGSGGDLIAYLFATVPGVSKVGSYSGTSALQVVDCGFSAGARFLIIKRTDSTGSWYVWDTERGIVTGNDPWLLLDSTSAENTTTDYIDPNSSGFELSASSSLNVTGREYIFLAIA